MSFTRSMLTRLAVSALTLALLSVGIAGVAAADSPQGATYEITITNLMNGQPLAPPVIAAHKARVQLFRVGHPASYGIQQVAENGNNAPLVAALSSDPFVAAVTSGNAPLVGQHNPGGTGFANSATYTLSTDMRANFLSVAAMLICTNDGFTGVNRLPLPQRVGNSFSVEAPAYDAGTELNTEDFNDLVPPCQPLTGFNSGKPGAGASNPALAEGGVIGMHTGISGNADLTTAVHGWSDPVVRITVTRVQ